MGDLHFGSQCCHGCLNKRFCIVGIVGEGFSNFVQLLGGDTCGLVVTVRDPDGMDSTVQQLLSLFQQSSGQN